MEVQGRVKEGGAVECKANHVGLDLEHIFLHNHNLPSNAYKRFALGAFGPTRDMGRPIVICAFGA